MSAAAAVELVDPVSRAFYVQAMKILEEGGVPFLVGGAYALARYTGIERHTKDFDLFIKRSDFERARKAFEKAGYRAELTFTHWIGKAFKGEVFVDLIFSAGNGVAEVDDLWFKHSTRDEVFGVPVQLIPAEEMIWSKGLILERERYDGADVAHMIKNAGRELDWRRLIDRYGQYWRVLYTHLILYGFIYPSRRTNVPEWVMQELGSRLAKEIGMPDDEEKICYGTMVSRQQYLIDINQWGFADARLKPIGKLTEEEIAVWTKGIEIDGAK